MVEKVTNILNKFILRRKALFFLARCHFKISFTEALQAIIIHNSNLFDPNFYLEKYEDVREKNINPILHYIKSGAKEGRFPNPIFDSTYYLNEYPDVTEKNLNPLVHFISHGGLELRNPSALFDSKYYLNRNSDLRNLKIIPLVHYIQIGYREKERKPNPVFNTEFYVKNNPNLNMTPLGHYISYGEKAGRKPSPFFDPEFYRNKHSHVMNGVTSPLEHFLIEGCRKGLMPAPHVNYAHYLRIKTNKVDFKELIADFFDIILPEMPTAYISPENKFVPEEGLKELYKEYKESEVSRTENSIIFDVNFFAPFHAYSGLGHASRCFYLSMKKQLLKLKTFSMPLSKHQKKFKFDVSPESTKNSLLISLAQINLDAMPGFLDLFGTVFLNSKYRIAHFVWELPSMWVDWLASAASINEIWVPSNFCKRTVSAFTNKKVFLVPYVVEKYQDYTPTEGEIESFKSSYQIPKDKFVYLYIFDASSYVERKNPMALVKAFQAIADKYENAFLILKISHFFSGSKLLKEVIQELKKISPEKYMIISEVLEQKDIINLMNVCDAYVSPHRCEGFGLTLAEALLYEKPVICTNYSSTTDFISEEVAYPVSYHLVEIEEDVGTHYRAGNLWAEIDRDHLSKRMEEVFLNYDLAKEKALLGKKFIEDEYSSEAVGKIIRDRILSITSVLKENI